MAGDSLETKIGHVLDAVAERLKAAGDAMVKRGRGEENVADVEPHTVDSLKHALAVRGHDAGMVDTALDVGAISVDPTGYVTMPTEEAEPSPGELKEAAQAQRDADLDSKADVSEPAPATAGEPVGEPVDAGQLGSPSAQGDQPSAGA